jgi:hypothetical protein
MTKLRLVEQGEAVKKLDSRRHLIGLFNKKYKDEIKDENPLPFAACMKAMQGVFKFEDQETGEITIEYPTEDAWTSQLDAMFQDEFCKKNNIYDFPYFLKQFGRFKVFKKHEQVKKVNITVTCDNCSNQRPPLGVCPHCGE